MLATFGFCVVAIFFAIFAFTFRSMVANRVLVGLRRFSYSYYLLALAFVIWAAASANGSGQVLQWSVVVGDGLLLLATFLLLDIVIGPRFRPVWIPLSLVAIAALLYVRIAFFFPNPYLTDGVLVFNAQTPVATALAVAFAFIWLPINAHVARKVANETGLSALWMTYLVIYSSAAVGAVVFLSARRPVVVILSFLAIGACFTVLIASNFLVKKMVESNGSQEPTT
jgi:hypothetical protein